MDSRFEVKWLTKAFEKLSKRLRFLETLPRPSSTVVDTFLELGDTPSVYEGYSGFAVFVNPAETGLQFEPVGGACVTFICGPVGWRATGGTIPRTLVHEVAFQLDTGGNARGDYAIDLQQLRWADDQVAAGEFSAILTNEENVIEPDSKGCSITGPYNEIRDWYPGVHILGQFNDAYSGTVYGGGYSVVMVGDDHEAQDLVYAFFAGDNQQATKPLGGGGPSALGIFSFIEQNEFYPTAFDYPTYTGSFGVFNVQEGDVWYVFQFGEGNKVYGSGNPAYMQTLWGMQNGYTCYSAHVSRNYLFGESPKSYLPNAGGYYDGRIVLSGDSPNAVPSDGTGYPGGYNQDSWFSQNDLITTWTVAWITSRFEFPIIQESAWGFEIYIVGTERFAANVYYWKIEGLIENAGGATTLKWSVVTNLFRDVATKEWQVIADDPNDRLVLQFRDTAGPDATICNIQFRMMTTEVGYN